VSKFTSWARDLVTLFNRDRSRCFRCQIHLQSTSSRLATWDEVVDVFCFSYSPYRLQFETIYGLTSRSEFIRFALRTPSKSFGNYVSPLSYKVNTWHLPDKVINYGPSVWRKYSEPICCMDQLPKMKQMCSLTSDIETADLAVQKNTWWVAIVRCV